MDRIRLGTLSATRMDARGERDGRAYWRIRGPSPERVTLWSGWATHDEVMRELVAIDGDPSRRERPGRVDRGPCRTVGDLLRRWEAAQRDRHDAGEIAQRTLKNYRAHVGYWLATTVAEVALRAVSKPHVRDQATRWLQAGIAPRTVDATVESLTTAIRWGTERELCPRVDVGIPTLARDDEHAYSGHTPARWEVDRVIDALPRRRAVTIELLALTGARIGEILALRVGDVDLTARTLRLTGRDEIRESRGKTGVRVLPARGRLLEVLRELAAGRPADERLTPVRSHSRVWEALEEGCRAAGVPRFSAHGLRRLVVGELLEVADPKTVAAWTGHSVATMLEAYVRPTSGTLEAMAGRAGLGDRTGVVVAFPAVGARHPGTGGADGQ